MISINNSGSSRSTFDASSRPCYHHRSSLPVPLRETLSPRSGTAADSSGLVSLDPPGHQANSGVQVDGVSSSFGAFADSSYLLSESTPSLFPNGGSQLKDLVRAWILQTRDGRSIVSAASGAEHHGDEEVSSCVSDASELNRHRCRFVICAFLTALRKVQMVHSFGGLFVWLREFLHLAIVGTILHVHNAVVY